MAEDAMEARTGVAGIVTVTSRYPVDETLERLRRAIAERGLTLFAEFDHAAGAAEAGLMLPPTTVLVFGSPKAGTPLMVAAPLVALELPLKVLVSRAEDGSTAVSFEDPVRLAQRFRVPESLVGNIAGVRAIVEAAAG